MHESFEVRVTRELSSKLRVAFLVAATLFGLFIAIDVLLDPTIFTRNFPVRAATVVTYLLLFAAARKNVSPTRLFYAGIGIGAASITGLSVGMLFGELLAAGSLLLMVVVLATLSTTRERTVGGYALLVMTFNVLAPLLGADVFFMVVVDVFLISGSVAGVMMGITSERLARRAFLLERELAQLASTDSLTGVRNRGSFLSSLHTARLHAQRSGEALSLLLVDIDRFKAINDTYGHPVGDAAIKAVCETASAVLRSNDVIGRIGGEEFAVLLPSTDEEQAQHVAERLRVAIAEQRLLIGDASLSFTVSVGAAVWMPGEPAERLMSRTDEALYAAKRGGRNRVVAAAA